MTARAHRCNWRCYPGYCADPYPTQKKESNQQMTWALTASGHTPVPLTNDGPAPDWHDVEQKLHDELSAVLSKPEYGCTASGFAGNYVTGDALHVPQDDPGVEHVHHNVPDTGL